MSRMVLVILAALALVALSACTSAPPPTPTPVFVTVKQVPSPQPTLVAPTAAPATVKPTQMVTPTTAPVAGMANPASVYCQQQGGKTEIRKEAKGEVGYCVFPDKSECEEWAFQRGECKPGAKPTAAASHADAFAYCSAVGNVDAPDARYTGAKTPDAIVRSLMKAMNMGAGTNAAEFARLTKWRCMGGKVYACNVGANIPCDEKADTNRTPTTAMNDFCKANPAASAIPAVVTGRATVYDWKCTAGKPAINKELTKPDARGYLTMYWYELAK